MCRVGKKGTYIIMTTSIRVKYSGSHILRANFPTGLGCSSGTATLTEVLTRCESQYTQSLNKHASREGRTCMPKRLELHISLRT
jgi:hypothetical protein